MKIPHMFQSALQRLRTELTINDILWGIISLILFILSSNRYVISNVDGFLTQSSLITVTLTNVVIALLLSVRKLWPEQSATIFIVTCIVQVIFGPTQLFADFFGFVLLVNAIARGNPEHSKAFVIAAYVTTVLSCAVISWNIVMGPIYGNNHSKASYTYSVRNINSSNIRNCISIILDFAIPSIIFAIIITTITVIIGYWQRTHVHTIQLLQEHNNAIRAYRKKAQHIAVTAERARIARDMHDIVAHTLSIIIVQADGGRYAATKDISLAKKTMHIIKNEAERAVHDMRRLLEALTDAPSGQLDFNHVPSLIEQAKIASPKNIFWHTVDGMNSQNRLNADAQTVAYRVVQESLTNIRKHAGDGIKINIHEQWKDQGLTLKITNEINKLEANQEQNSGAPHKNGYGLIGMKERIENLHGTLDYGKLNDGTFSIVAFIPYSYSTDQSNSTASLLNSIYNVTHNAKVNNQSEAQTKPENSNVSTSSEVSTNVLPDGLTEANASKNRIEKVSQWFEQHWLIGDIIYASPWVVMMLFIPTYDFIVRTGIPSQYSSSLSLQILYKVFTLTTMVPFMFRRKAPTACAIVAAVFSAIQLILLPNILFANFFIPNIIYAAVLYGKKRAWQWVSAVVLAESAIFAVKIGIATKNIPQTETPIRFFTSNIATTNFYDFMQFASVGLVFGFIVAIICFTVIAFAYYRRSDDNNLLLLKARRTELEQEQKQLEVLAANAERQRLSANIQQKVALTLHKVINAANCGISMLNKYEKSNSNAENRKSSEPEQSQEQEQIEEISKAFKNIGDEGRSALRYMRKLLGILRETGSSVHSANNGANVTEIAIRPAPSLDEQIQHNTLNKQE